MSSQSGGTEASTTTSAARSGLDTAADDLSTGVDVLVSVCVFLAVFTAAALVVFKGIVYAGRSVRSKGPITFVQPAEASTEDRPTQRLMAGAAAEVRAHQHAGGSIGAIANVDHRGDDATVDILPENAKFLAGLVRRLTFRLEFKVVLLDESPAHPVAAAAVTKPSGKVVDSETFALPAPIGDSLEDQLTALTRVIGSWLYFHAASRWGRTTPKPLLGTTNWRSFGYFRIGAQVHTIGGPHRTTALLYYTLALEEDPGNIGALLNRSAIAVRSTDTAAADRAISGLHTAAGNLRDEAPGYQSDPSWYRATYLHAVAHLHRANPVVARPDPLESDNDFEAAASITKELATKTLHALAILTNDELPLRDVDGHETRTQPARQRETLRVFLRSAESRILALWASVQLEQAARGGDSTRFTSELRRDVTTMIDLLRDQTDPEERAMSRRRWLCSRVDPNKKQLRLEDVRPRELVALITLGRELWSYSGNYNIACFNTRLAEHLAPHDPVQASASIDDALRHLAAALEKGDDLTQWADQDPTLRYLRETVPARFQRLLSNSAARVKSPDRWIITKRHHVELAPDGT
ncbi:MAG: hypothetical protein GY788_06865 [bacterium]|nr:hypothetical protein [bacterium]